MANNTLAIVAIGLLLISGILQVCVILGIIHYQHVWGGKLHSRPQMLRYESFALVITFVFVAVLCTKVGESNSNTNTNTTLIDVLLCVMAILFLLNTLGNIFSKSRIEKIIFAPITFLLTLICFWLAWH